MEPNGEASSSNDAMRRFLERTRSDTMFELRTLQHGVRPVTGQTHRETLEAFINRQVKVPEGPEGNKQNVPANRDQVEEHRPDAVVVEVEGLFEQRRVSSMLQSQEFRRRLEGIICGSISRSTRTPPPPAQRGSPRGSTPPPQPAQRTTTPPPPSRASLAVGIPHQAGLGPERSPSPREEDAASNDSDSASIAASVGSVTSSSSPAAEEPSVEEAAQEPQPQRVSWQEISSVHREQIVQEISQLLHQELVSNTLNGQFRGTLELQMQNHLSRTTSNGAEVENVIRSLPPSGILRNDFSHLGLNPPPEDSDNVSVTSFSATAVPYTHSNLHLSREIQSLKVQLAEMQRMLRLSFDLQMDIQRSVRQEVAAALASGGAQGARPASEALATSRSRPLQDDKCLICLDQHADCLLYQCGHLCLCYKCGRDLLARGSHCPICRAPIRDVVRAYRCNQD